MTPLTQSEEEEIRSYHGRISAILTPLAKELEQESAMSFTKAYHHLLKIHFGEGGDLRERQWNVKVFVWEIPQSKILANAVLVAESDEEAVTGFRGIAQLVLYYIRDQHGVEPDKLFGMEPPQHPFTAVEMERRMAKLRPAVNRGRGEASARWYYRAGDMNYMFQADIKRKRT